jgi:hypothetical protein
MTARRQSSEDHAERLNNGTCPVHGMSIEVDYFEDGQLVRTDGLLRMVCPRKDCTVRLSTFDVDGPYCIEELKTW